MSEMPGPSPAQDEAGRPTRALPFPQLLRISLYWLGLSSIFAGLHQLINGRILFQGLGPRGSEGTTLFLLTVGGAVVAMLVQPTVGSISDYTISRSWGFWHSWSCSSSARTSLRVHSRATFPIWYPPSRSASRARWSD